NTVLQCDMVWFSQLIQRFIAKHILSNTVENQAFSFKLTGQQ
ncbi:MAG: hypothetical protein ACI9SP_004810, partial [Arenicella sp.]